MYSALLLVRLISFVSIHYLPRIIDPIVIPQPFPPAKVVFSCIGFCLLVSIILDLSVLAIMTPAFLRRLKT